MLTQEFTRCMGSACNLMVLHGPPKWAAYSLAADCIISHFSVADLPQTVPVAYWYAASLEQSFILSQICRRLFLWLTSMQQVWSKVSSCRRSAADCSCGILVCGKSGAEFHPAADCSCGILVCGKSGTKFHPAADLPQTVPVAYWYAASLQQNFILPQICRRLFLWHTGMRQVCSKISFCRMLRHTLCRRLKVCRRSAAGLRHTFHFPMGEFQRENHISRKFILCPFITHMTPQSGKMSQE